MRPRRPVKESVAAASFPTDFATSIGATTRKPLKVWRSLRSTSIPTRGSRASPCRSRRSIPVRVAIPRLECLGYTSGGLGEAEYLTELDQELRCHSTPRALEDVA